MKDGNCNFLAEGANCIMVYIVCLTALFFGELLMKKSPGFFCALILGGIVAFCFLLRNVVSNFILYAILHLVVFGLLIFVPFSIGKIELLAFYLLFVILDFAFWMKQKKGTFAYVPLALIFLNALAYLYCDIKKNPGGMLFFFVLGILYFLFYYIRKFYANAAKLSKEKTQDERMPFSDMLRNGFGVAFPFVLLSVIVMILVRVDWIDQYAVRLYDFIIRIVGKAVLLVLSVLHWLSGLFVIETLESGLERAMGDFGQTESNPVLRILSAVVYIASLAVILFLVYKGIVALLKWIPRHRKLSPQVIEESDMVEIRERIVRSEPAHKEKLHRIRKKYKKTVEKAMGKGYEINRSHTPKERAFDMKEKTGGDINELTGLYEKIRYQEKA